MSIVDTFEKDVSIVDMKIEKIELRTSSIKLSSTLFSCSIHEIYHRVHHAKKRPHVKVVFS